jgi:hypothetical protein
MAAANRNYSSPDRPATLCPLCFTASCPTLESTGREHTAFNIIGEDHDESEAIERSGSMSCWACPCLYVPSLLMHDFILHQYLSCKSGAKSSCHNSGTSGNSSAYLSPSSGSHLNPNMILQNRIPGIS